MSTLSVLQNVRSKPHLKMHVYAVKKMLDYIEKTSALSIKIKGLVPSGEEIVKWKPYIHRFHQVYRRGILAKFYQLDAWYTASPKPITLMTLTCSHDYSKIGRYNPDGYTIAASFEKLNEGWVKLYGVMRYHLGKFDYVRVIEPHQMGYPHYHFIIFSEIDEELEDRIRLLYSEKYGIGSYENGVDFAFRQPSTDISSVKNYLMKYLMKTIQPEVMTPELLVFNAVMWINQYRLVSASADLSRVMARKDGVSDDFIWTETSVKNNKTGETRVIRVPGESDE